jgi:hypothetical protein
LVSTNGSETFPAAAPPNSAVTERLDARQGADVTVAAAAEMTAGVGLEIAACAGLDMAGGGESAADALEITDVLVVAETAGVAEAVVTDDNDDAIVVCASRDRHW